MVFSLVFLCLIVVSLAWFTISFNLRQKPVIKQEEKVLMKKKKGQKKFRLNFEEIKKVGLDNLMTIIFFTIKIVAWVVGKILRTILSTIDFFKQLKKRHKIKKHQETGETYRNPAAANRREGQTTNIPSQKPNSEKTFIIKEKTMSQEQELAEKMRRRRIAQVESAVKGVAKEKEEKKDKKIANIVKVVEKLRPGSENCAILGTPGHEKIPEHDESHKTTPIPSFLKISKTTEASLLDDEEVVMEVIPSASADTLKEDPALSKPEAKKIHPKPAAIPAIETQPSASKKETVIKTDTAKPAASEEEIPAKATNAESATPKKEVATEADHWREISNNSTKTAKTAVINTEVRAAQSIENKTKKVEGTDNMKTFERLKEFLGLRAGLPNSDKVAAAAEGTLISFLNAVKSENNCAADNFDNKAAETRKRTNQTSEQLIAQEARLERKRIERDALIAHWEECAYTGIAQIDLKAFFKPLELCDNSQSSDKIGDYLRQALPDNNLVHEAKSPRDKISVREYTSFPPQAVEQFVETGKKSTKVEVN
jgi:hypothetical protein